MYSPWLRTSTLSQGCAIASWLCLPCFPSQISNCLDLTFGTKGRSKRLNEAYFLQKINGGHRKAFVPRWAHRVLLCFRASVRPSKPGQVRSWAQVFFLERVCKIISLRQPNAVWMKGCFSSSKPKVPVVKLWKNLSKVCICRCISSYRNSNKLSEDEKMTRLSNKDFEPQVHTEQRRKTKWRPPRGGNVNSRRACIRPGLSQGNAGTKLTWAGASYDSSS